jgi:hypothetical protein
MILRMIVGTGCILELSRVHGADAYHYLRPGDRVRLEGGPIARAHITAGRAAVPLRPAAHDHKPGHDHEEAGL